MQVVKFPLKVMVRKYSEMVYFSQLDILHILERALRRSRLPLYFTQGFNPHVKISFSSGLKLGLAGEIDTTFYFTQPVSLSELKKALQPQLPLGLEVL
jgi:radical SAM-linked protein